MLFLILGIIIIILIVAYIIIYNELVSSSNQVAGTWHQIFVQLRRRSDLIPNLVETVKGYANYERGTLTKVTQLRGQMITLNANDTNNQNKQQMMNLSQQLSGALKSVFAVSERYPNLKADSSFNHLQDELTNTENKIAYSRQLYNNVVESYNALIQRFPVNIVAGHKFTASQYIQEPSNVENVPHVNFGNLNNNN